MTPPRIPITQPTPGRRTSLPPRRIKPTTTGDREMSLKRLWRAWLLGLALLTTFVPADAGAHLHQGHFVVGAAALTSGNSGWVGVSLSAYTGPLGTHGTVTLDGQVIAVECGVIVNLNAAFDTPTRHLAVIGWRIETEKYQLFIVAGPDDATPFFEVFTVDGDGSPCDRGSLGGLAGGVGQFIVGP